MYEFGVKIGNSFAWDYEFGPLLTDDWKKAVDFLRHTLWAQADHSEWDKFGAMSEEELLLAGKTSRPKVRLVRREVGEWKTVKQPKKKEEGRPKDLPSCIEDAEKM